MSLTVVHVGPSSSSVSSSLLDDFGRLFLSNFFQDILPLTFNGNVTVVKLLGHLERRIRPFQAIGRVEQVWHDGLVLRDRQHDVVRLWDTLTVGHREPRSLSGSRERSSSRTTTCEPVLIEVDEAL